MAVFGTIAALLDENGLSGVAEAPFQHTGFSGAHLTRLLRSDGSAFILKRLDIQRDWIMRATDDVPSREAALAAAVLDLGASIRTPVVGVARDGGASALLMADVGAHMLRPGPISLAQLDTIIQRMPELHRRPIPMGVPWCDRARRLTLLTPETARIAAEYNAPVARDIIEGWHIFDDLAPEPARSTIRRLRDDASPLIAALGRLPVAFLHGDLKLDNIGLDADGAMWLIDWALTLVAPPAVEVGWFMAINSRRLPVPLDDVMGRYAGAAGVPEDVRSRHDALTVMCGLLLRGWRKALDAREVDAAELHWWCERAELAIQLL